MSRRCLLLLNTLSVSVQEACSYRGQSKSLSLDELCCLLADPRPRLSGPESRSLSSAAFDLPWQLRQPFPSSCEPFLLTARKDLSKKKYYYEY